MRLRAQVLSGTVAATVAVLLLAPLVPLAACDSGPANHRPLSEYVTEQPDQRHLHGTVYEGTEPVSGAVLTVDPDPNLQSTAELSVDAAAVFPHSTSTDVSGNWSLQLGPLVYDMNVRRGDDLYVFRALSTRDLDAPLAHDAPPRGFTARLLPTTVPAPAAGHAVAFLVGGVQVDGGSLIDDARTLVPTPGQAGAYDAMFRTFDTTIELHAIEYVAALGITSAVAEGLLDIHVVNGTVSSPVIAMTPITSHGTVTFASPAPPGFTVGPIELELDFLVRTSAVSAGRATPGVPLTIAIVTNGRYSASVRATTAAGAVSRSGRHFFGFDPEVLELPALASEQAPFDDAAAGASPPGNTGTTATPVLGSGGTLAARFPMGIVEHVLTPAAGTTGATLHIATSSHFTTLPDPTRFGLPRPVGRYTWTVEWFPDWAQLDAFSGPDARVGAPSSITAPRVIELR